MERTAILEYEAGRLRIDAEKPGHSAALR
jgi:hypothetical protein